MNKKEIGASLRRGVVAGTLAGSVAGWASFATHAAGLPEPVAPADLTSALQLPALPAAPSLAPLPNVRPVQAPTIVLLPQIRTTTATAVTKTRKS